MEEERKLLILYGSQTGYAEDVARRISRQAWRRHFTAHVQALDQVDRQLVFSSSPVIFICSTTGQGEEPDNMKRFWRFLLRKSLPHDALSGMEFAVFGLGDSSYQKFNFPAKRLYRRLQQLGAHALVRRGDGDDQHYLGVDGQLDPWLEELWDVVLRKWPLPRPAVPDDVVPDPTFDVSLGGTQDMGVVEDRCRATLAVSERITAADHFQDVRHLRFAIEGGQGPLPAWGPGDCAVLRPRNLAGDVDAFLATVGWADRADEPLRIEPRSTSATLAWPVRAATLRGLCTSYFDIMGVPRRSFFEMLSYFAPSPEERDKLREFSSAAGQDDLLAYCMRPRRTVLEVLGDFPRTAPAIPLSYAFDVFPVIAERSFSISSAECPHAVDLTVAIVEYKTLMQRKRRGVCTRWLAQMPVGHTLAMRFARGTMRLPSPSQPIVMVGPGTGIAAFMSFIQSRPRADNYLFFGCRSASKDFYYQEQLQQWASEGSLHLYCAFSRDGPAKVYVQDRIREQSQLLWSLMAEQDAVVFVSGNANRMPDDVRQAFADVVSANNPQMSADDAQSYISSMVKEGRYQEECWY
ncbi:NAPDH-dependent diflavin reductase [Coemansia sp. RSA 2050]|nr:NAPDH-dependent diflavin reductase [Coemansia sp. RSA 2050]KAJ2731602.1 NAPDH-dependent diflavin reductase [Coemansia sp. BCRC 34962]